MENEINYLCASLYEKFYQKKCPFLKNIDLKSLKESNPIKIPITLIPLFWSGLMVFAYNAVLEFSETNRHSLSEFWKLLLTKITDIEIVDEKKTQEIIFPDYLHYYRFDTEEEKNKIQIDFFKKIFSHSFAGVWGIYFPFLWEYFQKGLCPISFFYHILTHKNIQNIIDISSYLLYQEENNLKQDAYFASTYIFLGEEKHPKVDFIDFILKNGCVNSPNKVKEEQNYA